MADMIFAHCSLGCAETTKQPNNKTTKQQDNQTTRKHIVTSEKVFVTRTKGV